MMAWIAWNTFCLTYLAIRTPMEFQNGNYIMGCIGALGLFFFIFTILDKVIK